MRKRTGFLIFIASVSLVLVSACGPALSLYPLYNKTDVIAQDQILGKWWGVDISQKKQDAITVAKCCWDFEKADDGGYALTISTHDEKKGDAQLFSTIHFLKLAGDLFLDVEPQSDDRLKAMVFPTTEAHLFGRAFFENGKVRLELLDSDWLQRAILQKRIHLDFTAPDSDPILTANTDELQKFALQYANDAEAFSNEFDLERPEPAKK